MFSHVYWKYGIIIYQFENLFLTVSKLLLSSETVLVFPAILVAIRMHYYFDIFLLPAL